MDFGILVNNNRTFIVHFWVNASFKPHISGLRDDKFLEAVLASFIDFIDVLWMVSPHTPELRATYGRIG